MKTPRTTNRPNGGARRLLRIGPATLVAFVAAAGVLIMGRLPGASRGAAAGPVVHQADAQGVMQRVQAAPAPAPAAPLHKPEPAELLGRSAELKLNAAQTKQVGSIDARWRAEKTALLADMQRATDGARTATHSAADMADALRGYSDMSRHYDARREAAWRQALFLLTPAQRAAAEKGGMQ